MILVGLDLKWLSCMVCGSRIGVFCHRRRVYMAVATFSYGRPLYVLCAKKSPILHTVLAVIFFVAVFRYEVND